MLAVNLGPSHPELFDAVLPVLCNNSGLAVQKETELPAAAMMNVSLNCGIVDMICTVRLKTSFFEVIFFVIKRQIKHCCGKLLLLLVDRRRSKSVSFCSIDESCLLILSHATSELLVLSARLEPHRRSCTTRARPTAPFN